MEIEQGECLFCGKERSVCVQDDASICHRCARLAVIVFVAALNQEMDEEELAALKAAGRALIDTTKQRLENIRDAATSDEIDEIDEAPDSLFPPSA